MDRTIFAAPSNRTVKALWLKYVGCFAHPSWMRNALILCASLASPAFGQVLLDDFNRPASTTVGGGWVETETAAAGAQINATQQLQMGSGLLGREWIYQDVSGAGLYNTTLNTNTCLLTWGFCMRQSRTAASGGVSGFVSGGYGMAYVLGATSSNFISAGQGYAVMYGQGGADPLRLVHFNNGLSGTLTNVIQAASAPYSGLTTEYLAVRVTYDPATGNWQLFAQSVAAAAFSTTNPTTVANFLGSFVNNTYTAVNLPFTGPLWNHGTAAENALFDNIYIPQSCTPTVNFASAAGSANEAVGSVVVTMNIFPATPVAGTIDVTVTDGPGVTYGVGNDYVSVPAVAATIITVPVAAGAATATFTLNVNDDALNEGPETISFALTGTTGGLALGSATNYVQTIVDNDGPPSMDFAVTSFTNLEGVSPGLVTFTINIAPAPTVGGNIWITTTNGPGVVYGAGNDYLNAPFGGASPAFIPYVAGATSVNFTATVLNDLLAEGTEQITFTITSVTGGPGATVGTNNTAVLYIADNDSPPTVLTAGDLAIVGINANNGACSGNSAEDYVSFFCFKQIEYNTTIILTDNGYERCIAGRWGNGEGTVQMRRTGPAIPAGQVITFRMNTTAGATNVIGVAPDAGWSCTSLNGAKFLNLNAGGDQLFFMQGGTWTTNTVDGQDAQYSGTVLYGFSTNPTFPWTASCGTNPTQRSNLPLGMNCFSMAPTSATDFSKYTGSLAPKTQRDWMIFIDTPANWTSPGSCAAYNGLAPNWLTAPTIPILAGSFTPGLWRGTTSTDWFDCKNWDDVAVPVATTAVTINQVASNHCVVGVTPGGTAVCASLNQTNGGTTVNLTVQNTSSLAIGGPLFVQRTAAGFPITLLVTGGSTLTATDCTVQGINPGDAIFRNQVPGNTVSFSGNFTIGIGGLVDLNGGASGGSIFIGGNYTNQGPTEATLDEDFGSIVFNGNGAQSISTGGFEEVFHDLRIAKPSGDVTLNDPIAIKNNLDLTTGLLNTTATNLATIRATGTTNNATDLSFVNGPLQKIGNTAFTFPVGKGASLRPCGITAVSGVLTDAFTAEYFPISAYTWGSNMEPTLNHISDCEYWIIDRSAGNADAVVQLTWDTPESCGVNDLASLVVARWDAGAVPPIWRDRGNGGACCSPIFGTIPTAAVETLFSPWTLASVNGNNPLPVELLDFTAKAEGPNVRLDWTTASERNNAWFTIERSADAVRFDPILTVAGAGNSTQLLSYSDLDRAPLNGMNYYRLRQTDTDGTSTLSQVRSVLMGGMGERPLVVYGNADVLTAVHSFPAGSRYELQDMTGRLVAEGSTDADDLTMLYVGALQHGAYLLRLSNGERIEAVRFVY